MSTFSVFKNTPNKTEKSAKDFIPWISMKESTVRWNCYQKEHHGYQIEKWRKFSRQLTRKMFPIKLDQRNKII